MKTKLGPLKLLDRWLMTLESKYSVSPTKRTIEAMNSMFGHSEEQLQDVPTTTARLRSVCKGISEGVLRVFVPGIAIRSYPSYDIHYQTLAEICAEKRERCAKCRHVKPRRSHGCAACAFNDYGETIISATQCVDDTHGKVNVIYYLVSVGGNELGIGYRLDDASKYPTDHSKFPGGEEYWVQDRVEVDLGEPCSPPIHCENCDPSTVTIALWRDARRNPSLSLSDVWKMWRSPDDFYFEFWFRKSWGVGPGELVVEKHALVEAIYGEFNHKQVWNLYLEAKRALKAWIHGAGILIAGLGYWIPLAVSGVPAWALALSVVLFSVEVVMLWRVLNWPNSGQHEHWESWRVLNDQRGYFSVRVGEVSEPRYDRMYEPDDELGRFFQELPLVTDRWERRGQSHS